MPETSSVPEFYTLTRLAVIDALTVIRNWNRDGKFFLRRVSFPQVSYYESGLPWFYSGQGLLKQTPLDFNYPFDALSADSVELPLSWKRLWQFVREDHRLKEFFGVDLFEGEDGTGEFPFRSITEVWFTHQLRQLVDHYIHVTGLQRYNHKKFLPLFARWARACYSDRLSVDFVIPIAMVDFEVDTPIDLTDSVRVEAMSESIQLGRMLDLETATSVSQRVVGAATHALILAGWELPNESQWERRKIPTNVDALEPVFPHIERFFAALRIVCGYNTGYAQIITRPVNWSDRWAAHLAPPYVVYVRKYPDRLDRHYGDDTRPLVRVDDLERIRSVYQGLERAGSNRLAIAASRLNSAYLRREEHDSIIDICIGLEALFVGEERGETTHKLATRVGAVWSLEGALDLTAHQAFRATKDLYAYRSALVHGSRKAERKRLIRARPNEDIEAISLGLDILRHSLEVAIRSPRLLEDGVLDEILLGRDSGGAL